MIRLLSRLWGWLSEPVDPQTSDQLREFVSAVDDPKPSRTEAFQNRMHDQGLDAARNGDGDE